MVNELTSVNEGRRGTSTTDDQISIKTDQKRDSSLYTSFVNVSCNKYQAHQLKSTLRNDMEISSLKVKLFFPRIFRVQTISRRLLSN